MAATITLTAGSQVRDHRGRVTPVAAIRPITASGRTVGLYAPDGALVQRTTAPTFAAAVAIAKSHLI